MFGSSHSHQRAPSHAIPIAAATGDSERRRGLQRFLVWPFLLGAAFASDDLSVIARATADEQSGPASPTGEETHSPPVDVSLDPVRLSDWEVNNPNQSTQNLLPEPHFPEALTAGGIGQPVASTPIEAQPLHEAGGGGRGSSSAGGGAGAVVQADGSIDPGAIDGVHIDVGSGTIAGVVQSVEGAAEGLLHGVEGLIGESGLSVGGTLLSNVGHAITSLLSGSAVGESPSLVSASVAEKELSSALSAHASSDVVASGGTIAFGAVSPENFMPQLTINGSYTDFGIAMQAPSADTLVASTDHPHGAPIDIGPSLDQHDPASTASIHLNDDTNLRTPMDLFG